MGVRKALRVACAIALVTCATIHDAVAETRTVRSGDNLQAAINAALPGDVILLEAAATFRGNFTLPTNSGTDYITIRSTTPDGELPADGVRITPSHASRLPKIQSPNTAPAMRTEAGAHHWRLLFLEFAANQSGAGEILRIGDGSSAQSQLSQVPYQIDVDRVFIHGDPAFGQKRGIALNGRAVTIRNSYISDIKYAAQDAQAIGGWNGPGPYVIENNYLEASGENFLLGGADPSIPNLVTEDVVFRRNHVTKPLAWRSESWQIKNLFELKNARRVLIEYNLFENNWQQAQAGYAILFTPRNQDGGCAWCVVESITFQYNIVRNVAGGFNLTGYDWPNLSAQTRQVRIQQNLFYGISTSLGGTAWLLLIGDEPRDIVVDHNTIDHEGTAVVYAHGGTATAPEQMYGFQFTNNAQRHNAYGINGANFAFGNGVLTAYFPEGVVRGNWLSGGPSSRYPSGNLFSGAFGDAFVNAAAGDYRLAAGSILAGAATDGTDIGADLATLRVRTAGVIEGLPLDRPRAPANLRIISR